MGGMYGLDYRGHKVGLEANDFGWLSSRVRLFVDGRLVDERQTSSGASLRAEIPSEEGFQPVKAEVAFDSFGEVKRCVLISDGIEYPMRETNRNEDDEGDLLGDLLDLFP